MTGIPVSWDTVHYDFYNNVDYSIVIRYNEMPEFSNPKFRDVPSHMLTFYFLGLGIITIYTIIKKS